jgi:hypothetical protein
MFSLSEGLQEHPAECEELNINEETQPLPPMLQSPPVQPGYRHGQAKSPTYSSWRRSSSGPCSARNAFYPSVGLIQRSLRRSPGMYHMYHIYNMYTFLARPAETFLDCPDGCITYHPPAAGAAATPPRMYPPPPVTPAAAPPGTYPPPPVAPAPAVAAAQPRMHPPHPVGYVPPVAPSSLRPGRGKVMRCPNCGVTRQTNVHQDQGCTSKSSFSEPNLPWLRN